MSTFRIFDIAGSALTAQSLRLNLIASNLANAESISAGDTPSYRARQPVFSPVLNNEYGDYTGGENGRGSGKQGAAAS